MAHWSKTAKRAEIIARINATKKARPTNHRCVEGCTCGRHNRPKCAEGCTCNRHSAETRAKLWANREDRTPWNKGKTMPPDIREANGRGNARRLLENPTPDETTFATYLRGKGIDYFIEQWPVGHGTGYVADFYVPAWNQVIEIDGGAHPGWRAPEIDAARDALIRSLGIYVRHVTSAQVQRLPR